MSQSEAETVLVDFVSHGEIAVSASPEAIWPAIVDTNGWHGTWLTSVGGPPGEVGERFHASDPANREVALLHIENVELDLGRRRTIRINTPDGSFSGYSSWLLTERGAETVVGYDVFCLYPFPKDAL